MGEFVRSRSKVWWGNFHADDDGDDEDDDDDWRLGVASCCSANNSFSDSDRGSSGSPESHKSQDSGFSDSESNSLSTGLSLTRIPRPSLLSRSNREKSIGCDKKFDSSTLLCQGEEEETEDPEEGSSEESKIMGKNKDCKVKGAKGLKSSNSSGLPLRDIKNTLETSTTNKRNLGLQIVKTNVDNERYHDIKSESNLNKNIDNLSLDQNNENDDNFSSYQEKNENKQKYNFVVNELKTSLQESNCKKNRKTSLKDGENFSCSITIGDNHQSSDLNQTKITDNRLNERSTDDCSASCSGLEFREYGDYSRNNHKCDEVIESSINSRVTSDDNKNFKVPEIIPSKSFAKNGTKPKFKLNSAKSITKYFQPNRSLERTKLRKSQVSESSVRKLFLQNDPNRSLEQTRVLRSQLKKDEDDPSEELNLSNHENDQKQDSVSSDSSYFHTEDTARFVGDLNTNGIDSSTWSIPGPPTHCSTPKSSSEPERIPHESMLKMTPHRLCFDEKEILPKERSITSYQQPNFDAEVQIENKPLNHWLNEVRFLYEPECMTTLQSKSLTADLNSQVTIMAAVTTEAVRSLQYRTKLISTEFTKLYRKVESGVLDHVGPLVQSLVGHVTEFLETCNLSGNDQQLLIKACDRLRSVADGSKLNQHVLATETTNLGRTFTYCVDTLLLEQVKVLMAVLDEPSSPILLLTALSSLTGLGLEGQHLSQLIARCPGGIRAILTICIDSRNTSVRSAALRTLTTVCSSSHTIRQLEQAGGVEVLSEILQDDTRSEMELSEAVSVIVQITAPWIEDNHSVLGLSQQLVPLVSSFTRIVSNTTSSSTLLLCAAALCHLSQLEPQCIWTMLENSTAGTLLLAIRLQGPFSPVFLREQAAGLLANMAAVPEARAHLAEHRAVVALLCFLQVRHSPLQSSAEVAAAERLQHKSAIALSRLCSDPAVAAQVVELQGVTRLVRLCKEEHERNHSDGVLVACLAALRKIVANCGTKSVEELNALELVEPRLLDSFLIYSSRQESYV